MKNLNQLLAEKEYAETPKELGLDGTEEITLVYDEKPSVDLTIYAWKTADEQYGFLRDDSSGLSAIGTDTLQDEETLAAWNADFDIRKLDGVLSTEEMTNVLEEAKSREWGFDNDGNNIWDDENNK